MIDTRTIAIADEDIAFLRILQGKLEEKFTVVPVKNIDMLMKLMENRQPELILIGKELCGNDPAGIVSRIRSIQGCDKTAVLLILDEEPDSNVAKEIGNAGANGYVSRETPPDKVVNNVEITLAAVSSDKLVEKKDGVALCGGSEEVYSNVSRTYISASEEDMKNIKEFCEKEDIENYTIKVHALKNAAKVVGCNSLAADAFYLEQCGKAGDIAEIKDKTDKLLEKYKESIIELKKIIEG